MSVGKGGQLFDTGIESGAQCSPCRIYRYALWRRWDDLARDVMFIGLNPSTADESEDDPTIRRCIRFAKDWGFGGLRMLNAYSFRATDPKNMKAAAEPIGEGNNDAIKLQSKDAGLIVAAWGVHCSPERALAVCNAVGRPIHCLGKTKDGYPKHPLYLRSDTKPELFWVPSSPICGAEYGTEFVEAKGGVQ